MNFKNFDVLPYGEHGILVKWEEKIDEKLLDVILSVKNCISKHNIESIVEITHTYNSLLIEYDICIKNIYEEILTIKPIISTLDSTFEQKKTLYHLPVCYDEKFGIDSKEITAHNELDFPEIKALHSTPVYTLFFLGFLPGFLYLGGLDEKLFFPRKKSPRKSVEKGSVGIAGNQTGIYPKSSPGGWQIIGNCPVGLFDPKQNPPSIFKPGDKIQFYPIGLDEHREISEQVKTSCFKIKSETYGN